MIIEINYFVVLIAAAVLSAVGSLIWAAGRSLLAQYGALLRDQLAQHRSDIDKRTAQVEAAIDAHVGRIARLEHDLRGVPTHDDLKRLHARIDGVVNELHGVSGDVKAINQKADSLGKTLTLIHEYMLTGGSKK